MSKQTEALRLADALEQDPTPMGWYLEAAAELRRLHEEVQMQLQALKAARQLMESAYQLSKKDQALLRQALECITGDEDTALDPNAIERVSKLINAIRQRLGETE